MAALTKGNKFPEKVVQDMFVAVQGKSSLARFSDQIPMAFTGNKIFTFTMDKEMAVVGEGAAKAEGGIGAGPVTVTPIKLEYGARVTDEFLYASEEDRVNLLESFQEGFAKKMAKAIDIIGITGKAPRGGASVSGVANIDASCTAITQSTKAANVALNDAVAALGDYDVTGIIVSKAMASELDAIEGSKGGKMYPDFKAWGNAESYINGVETEVNTTLGTHKALVGDFSAFKWGYCRDIDFEVIEYGDPDNSGKDLKGQNQVYLRAEVYIGVACLDPNAFAVVNA